MSVENSATANRGSSNRAAPNLLRFLSDPRDFSGDVSLGSSAFLAADNSVNPLNWIRKLERLKDLAGLSDKEILLIAADHLVGKAGSWYEVSAAKITSWSQFVNAFKKKYCSGMDDVWWREIKNLKQMDNETVEDVDVKLRELYSLVGVDDETTMIRSFMEAIKPYVAYELERNEGGLMNASNRKLEDVVAAAVRQENVGNKYHVSSLATGLTAPIGDAASDILITYDKNSNIRTASNAPVPHAVGPIGNPPQHSATSETSEVMNELLKEFRELKINMLNSINKVTSEAPRQYGNPGSRVFTCFNCGETGHKKYECPKLSQGGVGVATGPNATPLGSQNQFQGSEESKKANEHHL